MFLLMIRATIFNKISHNHLVNHKRTIAIIILTNHIQPITIRTNPNISSIFPNDPKSANFPIAINMMPINIDWTAPFVTYKAPQILCYGAELLYERQIILNDNVIKNGKTSCLLAFVADKKPRFLRRLTFYFRICGVGHRIFDWRF